MAPRKVTVATRRSSLALAQSRAWIARLRDAHPGLEVEELYVTTTGDRVQDRSLSEIGGKGLFIKEIEQALVDNRAQLAVHSMKDVPAELMPGLTLGCISAREDARDVVVTRGGQPLARLPAGSRVGTSSLRRSVQLGAYRSDLMFVPLRGNVDTRLRRCAEGVVDAVVLARAGLVRLGRAEEATEILEPEVCVPAAGQGALGIEVRADDTATLSLLAPLHDATTGLAVAAERGVMHAVGGSCQLPLAAHAVRAQAALVLTAVLAEPDGTRLRRRVIRTAWPRHEREAWEIGSSLGRELRDA
jgi:hydroxymethylbilane synthase